MINPVIPTEKIFYHIETGHELDYEAICFFVACGFFLHDDTFWTDQKVVLGGYNYERDQNGNVTPGTPYFQWHYSPRDVSFNQVVEEFAHLFEQITREQVRGKKVILPLSGGLDSRSQAVALHAIEHKEVNTYSYGFENSFNETLYGKKIASELNMPFVEYRIPKGYLWDHILRLSAMTDCYSEFTHSRQMAVIDQLGDLGNLFWLGHWGDVLFDDMGIDSNAGFEQQLAHLKKKVLKKGGLELASALWSAWGLPGTFEQRLNNRLAELLDNIKIDDANARIRAFKSSQWAHRWTSENLRIFSSKHPIELPYYDQRMCEFVCTVPEKFLAGRQIQIEYMKMRAPNVAKIEWQSFHPCNLFNYKDYHSAKFITIRAWLKLIRGINKVVANKGVVQRNWELQFLGADNDRHLQQWLFENDKFKNLVPNEITRDVYSGFKNDNQVHYSHPLSMLLTLSVFANNNR